MKKNKNVLFLWIAIACIINSHAQVGINTSNPQGIFHVDGKGNTSGNTNSSDDVIVTNSGRVGIGTLSPKAKLDIHNPGGSNSFKLANGMQGVGKVLSINNFHDVNWENARSPEWIKSPVLQGISAPYSVSPGISTGYSINIPAGTWFIFYNVNWVCQTDTDNTQVGYLFLDLRDQSQSRIYGTMMPIPRQATFFTTPGSFVYTTATNVSITLWVYQGGNTFRGANSEPTSGLLEAIRWK